MSIVEQENIALVRNPELLDQQLSDILKSRNLLETSVESTTVEPIGIQAREPVITKERVILMVISAIIFMIIANTLRK